MHSQSIATTTAENLRKGPFLDVLRDLLGEGRQDDVISLVTKLLSRNEELEKRLAKMLEKAHRNEGVSSGQLKLLLEELLEAELPQPADVTEADQRLGKLVVPNSPPKETEQPRRQPSLRRPISKKLPRVENPLPVPPEERACPVCGSERTCMGHDVTEVLELIPAQIIVRVDRREKLACGHCEGELVRGPVGDKIVAGGRLGTTLVAEMLVDKYRDGLTLYRQKQRFERLGLNLPSSTLGDQITWATDLLRPLWRCAFVQVLAAEVMHLDGTGVPVLDREAPRGIRLGSLWGYVGGEAALYLYASTGKSRGQREGEMGPGDLLELRYGLTVADASSIFDQGFNRDGIIECGCNMHGRRYFANAFEAGDKRCSLPLGAYKKLYEVEDAIAELTVDEKTIFRQSRSKPIYDELIVWAQAHKPHEPPSSGLGKAIQYLLNHRVALMRFLEDGRIPIDNGVVERLHVRTALTRKNFLFCGSDAGAERAAIAYTVLGCCQLAGVNPSAYLAAILPILAGKIRLRDLPALMPSHWKIDHPEHRLESLNPHPTPALHQVP